MDPVSALGILGVIFNFFELSGKLLFHAREIHKSPKGLTAAIQDADAISTDLLNSFKLLKALGSSAASRDVDQNLLGLVTPCTEIAEELLKISQRLANRDKKQKAWSTAVQAFLSVATQRKVDDLICRLERLKGQVHMYAESRSCNDYSSMRNVVKADRLQERGRYGPAQMGEYQATAPRTRKTASCGAERHPECPERGQSAAKGRWLSLGDGALRSYRRRAGPRPVPSPQGSLCFSLGKSSRGVGRDKCS